jgi:hypothetical protein
MKHPNVLACFTVFLLCLFVLIGSGFCQEEKQSQEKDVILITSADYLHSHLSFEKLRGLYHLELSLSIFMPRTTKKMHSDFILIGERVTDYFMNQNNFQIVSNEDEQLMMVMEQLADPGNHLPKFKPVKPDVVISLKSIENTGPDKMFLDLILENDRSKEPFFRQSYGWNREEHDRESVSEFFCKVIHKALYREYPPAIGQVVEVQGNEVTLNLSKEHGIQPGDSFRVVRKGKPIIHNGANYGNVEESVGLLEIKKVLSTISKASVAEQEEGQEIQPGDKVYSEWMVWDSIDEEQIAAEYNFQKSGEK